MHACWMVGQNAAGSTAKRPGRLSAYVDSAKKGLQMTPLSLLNVVRLPARLTVEQVGELLGLNPLDVSVIAKARLLIQLGKPNKNSVKWFAAVDVEAFGRDRKLMDRAQLEIQRHWSRHNSRKAT